MSELWTPPGAIVAHGAERRVDGMTDKLIGENTLGGPLSRQDARMFLDGDTLEKLLDVARASITGRVVLNQVGFKQRVWQTPDGHVYQTLVLISLEPKAETSSMAKAMGAS